MVNIVNNIQTYMRTSTECQEPVQNVRRKNNHLSLKLHKMIKILTTVYNNKTDSSQYMKYCK